ncbi:MAG: virulence RhuM family protein [Candidatus Peribacteria bacterium]|jgi:hypothetical protein|nr:virulence RhuM family protein [Candidatus Peribacteria bacterium]
MPITDSKQPLQIRNSTAEFLIFIASIGETPQQIEIRYENENIWLTQKLMATLYGVDVRTINYHIKKILEDKELSLPATIQKFRIVQNEGKRAVSREIEHYNLQMIIAVGFKVNNERAVQFRKWANQIVKDYTIKGRVMDEERFKKGGVLTDQYFEEQLEKIREIRISERKFYQKITDIYATSLDYDPSSVITIDFFKKVQNKLHWAIHHHTAAENMAKRKIPMTMKDWIQQLNQILLANKYELLQNAGNISMELAKQHAETEFEKYRIVQDRVFKSDFDKFLEEAKQMLPENKKADYQ